MGLQDYGLLSGLLPGSVMRCPVAVCYDCNLQNQVSKMPHWPLSYRISCSAPASKCTYFL